MSYILESLKKSQKERNPAGTSASLPLSTAPFLENDRPVSFQLKLFHPVVFVIGAALVIVLAWWYLSIHNMQLLVLQQQNSVQTTSQPLVSDPPASVYAPAPSPKTALQKPVAGESFRQVSELYTQIVQKPEGSTDTPLQDLPGAIPDQDSKKSNPANNQASGAAGDDNNGVENLVRSTELENTVTEEPGTKNKSIEDANTESISSSTEPVIPSIYELNRTWKKRIPPMAYTAHVFASDFKSGFVILNGARRRIGDRMENGVYIEKITGDGVVLSYDGIVFSLPAMKNWTGG